MIINSSNNIYLHRFCLKESYIRPQIFHSSPKSHSPLEILFSKCLFADPFYVWQNIDPWSEVPSHNPAWCDLCGELIWGLYDTGAWQCALCSYTAHLKCREMVRLDCSAGLSHDRLEDLSLADEVRSQLSALTILT